MQTVRIQQLPDITKSMQTAIRDGQRQAAFVWNTCRALHMEARHRHEKWPSTKDLRDATKGGRFLIHSQTVQAIIDVFLANVDTARQLRAKGQKWMRYPYRDKKFFPLMWPHQAMSLYENRIVLPMGRNRRSITLPRPEGMPDEGTAAKIVWNGTGYELHWAIETPCAPERVHGSAATCDLGQIHQAAIVTDAGDALIVSGRGIRSIKRRRNMELGKIQAKQSRCKRGSRRWNKLSLARSALCGRTDRQVRDLRHKGTRAATDFCKSHDVRVLYVGNPDGVRRKRSGRHHNQRMSQWEYGKDIDYLEHKQQQAGILCFKGTERGTSSHCPVCGHRHKPGGRVWRCKKCKFVGHRDLVGGVNMHPIAYGQVIAFPHRITYLRPSSLSVKRAAVNEYPAVGSSSRPDTGQGNPNCSVAARRQTAEPTGSPEPSRGQGRQSVSPSEAYPL